MKELDAASRLLMVLLHSATIAHVLHWKTPSYSIHKAMGKYYKLMPDLADTLAESIFGKYSTITDYEDHFMLEDSPLQYMTEIQDYVNTQRKLIAQDAEIQNSVDAVMELINSTVYKLRQFTED